jgi:hypothetical protein
MSINDRIELAPFNHTTEIRRYNYDASHGSLGGEPGFNDDEEGDDYNYLLDRSNSISVHDLIILNLREAGIDASLVDHDEFGYPLQNPRKI